MFPHAKHTPACATQRTIENVVAPLVASNLRQPIGTVAFRHPAMRWAAVPETTTQEKWEPGMETVDGGEPPWTVR